MEIPSKMNSIHRWRRGVAGVFFVLLVLVMSHAAMGQTFSASISGTVTDASGAALKGAQLKLTNTVTNDQRVQTTSDAGTYAFTNLLPGTYSLTATGAGFKEFVRSGMELRANTAATVDVALQVGGGQEQVTVSAEGAVLMDTASANTSVTLDQQLLSSLPNNTLQPLNFVYALAGTTESQGMSSRSSSQDQMASTFGLNGGRSAESEILIDGAPSTAIDWGGLMVSPMQDSVQEEQVAQNVYDAQYERGGEGVVTLVTKSGTSQFHGELYDFMRNSAFDANSWSNDYWGTGKGKFHRNQFGGNIGGPLWRSRNLFFFGAYEGLRQPGSNGTYVGSVPSDAERNGDFSNSHDANGNMIVIYNPFSTHQVTDSQGHTYYTRDPFPGNKIPQGLWDATGQKIMALYPHANQAAQGGGNSDYNNFVKRVGDVTENDKYDARIDWAASDRNRLFGRVSQRIRQNDTPDCVFCNGADSNYVSENHGVQVVVNDTWTPSQRWVVDMYGAFTRWLEGQTLVGYGTNPSVIGLPANLFQVPALPVVNATEYAGMGAGYSTFDRYVRYYSTGLVNISRQLTRHTLKFGGNYDVSLINNRQDAPGSFNFSGALTNCDPHTITVGKTQVQDGPCQANAEGGVSGLSIADMLLGVGGGENHISMDPAFSVHSYGLYVQDDWKLNPRMTVSLGFRYENQRPATERHNRVAYFDAQAVNPISSALGTVLHGAFEYAGVGGRGRSAWDSDNNDFGPRVGLAYRVTDRLVARAGIGIFYGPNSAMLSFDDGGQSPGYTAQTPWIGTQDGNGYIPTNLVSNPFPNGQNLPTGNSLGAMTDVGYGVGQLWPKGPRQTGTMYQWSTDVQYQVSPHAVAQIGYTGVRGRHLMFGNPNLDLNQLPTQDLAMGSALDETVPNPFSGIITDPNSDMSGPTIARNRLMRPYPEYKSLQATRSLPGADSQFDALDVKYNYSFYNGLSSITTYRWSKNLDDGSEALLGWTIGGSWRDANNPKLDYSLSTRDVPHSFAEAFLYQSPYGTGRRWGGSAPAIVRETIGGWNLSSTIRLTSGYPLWTPVSFGIDNPLWKYGFPGYALPNLVGNPIPRHRTAQNWINPDAFQGLGGTDATAGQLVTCGQDPNCQPFPYSYGNEPQHYNTLREAPTKNLDVGIGKEFSMERVHAELRGDFLNVFNHPVYGGPWNITNHFGWGPVGQVQGTRNDSRNIQVALKLSF